MSATKETAHYTHVRPCPKDMPEDGLPDWIVNTAFAACQKLMGDLLELQRGHNYQRGDRAILTAIHSLDGTLYGTQALNADTNANHTGLLKENNPDQLEGYFTREEG